MKLYFRFLFPAICFFLLESCSAQENAAPSMHLVFSFPSRFATLKMQKIKITKSANCSYFEVNSTPNGYCGFQQSPDKSFSNPNIFLFSTWDYNTAKKIFSKITYLNKNTIGRRFGGEGDGCQTINLYGWKLNTWYNVVNRTWRTGDKLYIATFINDLSSKSWFHTATIRIPFSQDFLASSNDSFLENWTGFDPTSDGRFVRQAFFQDCYILTDSGKWETPEKVLFGANGEVDVKRNGKYHNSYNAYLDKNENAYCMQHGGDTKPSVDFNGRRELQLPINTTTQVVPELPAVEIESASATLRNGKINVTWNLEDQSSPQLSTKFEIKTSSGEVLATVIDTLPERREISIDKNLKKGSYEVSLAITDIFNQVSKPFRFPLIIEKD